VVIHDYAWICPRITLVAGQGRYCGEPNSQECEHCYSDIGGRLEEEITPSNLRLRSHAVLTGAQRVVVPSQDVARRLRTYFPEVSWVVTPWEKHRIVSAPSKPRTARQQLRVAVVGAIGLDKGYEYLLACARHVAMQQLPIQFVIVGYTSDDKRLWDTGVVHITGQYQEAEAIELIVEQDADVGLLRSVWPETWCYTLTQLWKAGLSVVAFDIGTPAERIANTGKGKLVPLGLSPVAMCSVLLEYRAEGDCSTFELVGANQ
jgi:glycosyltransferase involved in cell wall biosynthesis